MRRAPADRGQATVEALGLWLALALLVIGVALALPRFAPVLAAALDRPAGDDGRTPAVALADRALAGAGGRGGTPTLLAAERLLALELGTDGARRYLRRRLLARQGGRFGHAVDVTGAVAAIGGSDRLVAYPTRPPSITIAGPADEPAPGLDAGAAGVALAAAPGAALTAMELAERTRPLAKLLGRAQVGRDVITLVAAPDEVGPEPGERAGDAVLCEPVQLRWTMGGAVHAPLATALHLVVVRGGRVLADRFADGDRCP